MQRFWDKVEKTADCWKWLGAKRNGYGNFWHNRKGHIASRFAWELTHGPISAELFVCHSCDNPECVNPAHLFLGTAKDNYHDMARKNRVADTSGELHGNAKLTSIQIVQIRNLYATGKHSQEALGEMFGIGQTCVSKIVRFERWQD